jgi:hypothetical protein
MKHSEPVSVREVSIVETSAGRSPGRTSLIAWLLEALYVSRRREARRVIHRYRHLIAEDCRNSPALAASVAVQAREYKADADRDKTPLRANHRTLEDA